MFYIRSCILDGAKALNGLYKIHVLNYGKVFNVLHKVLRS